MTLYNNQANRIDAIQPWAKLAGELRDLVAASGQPVHLRPSGTGVSVVDLDPSRPQLERGRLTRTSGAPEKLRTILERSPGAPPRRPTPEKRLQAALIAEAYRCGGILASLGPDIEFVTDEQRFPGVDGDFLNDLLAIRTTERGPVPVTIELKSERSLTRLIAQVSQAASTVDLHLERFSRLCSALCGRNVTLSGPCERWVVWPALRGSEVEPRAAMFAAQGIVIATYREEDDALRISVKTTSA
jgi:hypothetical protein